MSKIHCLVVACLLPLGVFAAESSKVVPEKTVVKSGTRPKKIAICPTCGRPEPKCECEGENKKGDEREGSKKGETGTKSKE